MAQAGAKLSTQRRWSVALLVVGGVGFLTAIGMKIADAGVHSRGLLFLSLGLVCLALGLGWRLEWQLARLKLRRPRANPGSPVSATEPVNVPSTALVYAGVALIALSWLLAGA